MSLHLLDNITSEFHLNLNKMNSKFSHWQKKKVLLYMPQIIKKIVTPRLEMFKMWSLTGSQKSKHTKINTSSSFITFIFSLDGVCLCVYTNMHVCDESGLEMKKQVHKRRHSKMYLEFQDSLHYLQIILQVFRFNNICIFLI